MLVVKLRKCTILLFARYILYHLYFDTNYMITIKFSGGCKHAVAFLGWLHRRSEEPSPTSTICYWKKCALSSIGSTLTLVKCEALGQQSRRCEVKNAQTIENSFLNDVIQSLHNDTVEDCLLLNQVSPQRSKLSIHQLMVQLLSCNDKSPSNFRHLVQNALKESDLNEIALQTVDQYKSALWSELRYGRITASKLHETAQCTSDGTLVKKTLGAKTFKDNKYVRRGRDLEPLVLNEVKKN
jgi:hypothetical protein